MERMSPINMNFQQPMEDLLCFLHRNAASLSRWKRETVPNVDCSFPALTAPSLPLCGLGFLFKLRLQQGRIPLRNSIDGGEGTATATEGANHLLLPTLGSIS